MLISLLKYQQVNEDNTKLGQAQSTVFSLACVSKRFKIKYSTNILTFLPYFRKFPYFSLFISTTAQRS